MLDWYMGECMESIINTNNGIKDLPMGLNTNQILIFGGIFRVRNSLYTQSSYLGQDHSKPY
jgi:hypothetical protein